MAELTPEERIARLRASRGQSPRSIAEEAETTATPAGRSLAAPDVTTRVDTPPVVTGTDAAADPASVSPPRSWLQGLMSFEPRPHPARVARRGIGLVATAGFVALLPMMGSLSAGEDEDNVPDDGVAPDPAALNSPSASLIPETTVTATTIEVLGQASATSSTTTTIVEASTAATAEIVSRIDEGDQQIGAAPSPVESAPEQPTSEPQSVPPPSIAAPAAQSPVAQPPVAQPPAAQPRVTKPPVTAPPVTAPPVTQPPVTQPPVTQPPVTAPPAPPPPPVTAPSGG